MVVTHPLVSNHLRTSCRREGHVAHSSCLFMHVRTLPDRGPLEDHFNRFCSFHARAALMLIASRQYLMYVQCSSSFIFISSVFFVVRLMSFPLPPTCAKDFCCGCRLQRDQIGRFIALWASFQSLWQQLFCPNCPHF